jgi:F-type H+-transporting ATPase subunit c
MMLAEAGSNAAAYEVLAKSIGVLGGVIGAGLIVMGAARGIGALASSATEAIARQPEAGGRIFTTMIIAAALIEGVTLFALIICLLAVL